MVVESGPGGVVVKGMGKYIGYHEDNELPIKRGDVVTIPKGTTVRTMHPSRKLYVTKRSQKVTVDHILNGIGLPEGHPRCDEFYRAFHDHETSATRQIRNPSIRWPGTGGYWCEADINDVLEAKTVVKFKEHDVVRMAVAMPDKNLVVGSTVAIVHVHPEAYKVEVVTVNGNETITVPHAHVMSFDSPVPQENLLPPV